VKRVAAVILTVVFLSSTSAPVFHAQGQPNLLNLLQGLYINNLQQTLELTDDQFSKLAVFLKEFVRDSYNINIPQKNQARRELNQALQRGANDEELSRLIKEYDQIFIADRAVRDKFFASADPLLQVSQRAKLRIYIFQKEQQIARLIQQSQNPTPTPGKPPATKPSPHQ